MDCNFNFQVGFLFDLDGVLIDSERKYTEIWHLIDTEFPTGVQDFERVIKGTTLDNILSTYFSEADRPKVVKILYEQEAKMRYEYCPGAHRLLKELKEHEIATALVTSSNKEKMNNVYMHIPGFGEYFRVIVDADMITHSKPDPEGYLLAAHEIEVAPEHCVVFEDSLQGVMAGRASGAYVVGVAGTLGADTIRPYSDMVVDTLENFDLESLIGTLQNR